MYVPDIFAKELIALNNSTLSLYTLIPLNNKSLKLGVSLINFSERLKNGV